MVLSHKVIDTMLTKVLSGYADTELKELTIELKEKYYDVLKELCNEASSFARSAQVDDEQVSTALYASMSAKLIEQVGALISLRNDIIIPYVDDLLQKEKENHDCKNCAGNCHVEHNAHMFNIKDSHKKIKEILYRLQMVALPLYSESEYPISYKILRNEMMQIDTALTQLFYLEEAFLVPKIMEAKKRIHA